jgi:ribosomal protein RSM22 (predicted rRNA methylase)
MLPNFLKDYLLNEAQKQPLKDLRPAREQLSLNYREQSGQAGFRLNTEIDRHIYRLSRLPAIYAVIERLANEIQSRWPDFEPQSLLDLGAGPGTATLALTQQFSSISKLQLYERDREQVRWGQTLFKASGLSNLQQAQWEIADLTALQHWPKADLTCLSYVLNELAPDAQAKLLTPLLMQETSLLLLIEPGTPRGYKHILAARQQALEAGWQIVGPCPHALICPLSEGDWCHFGARLQRSQIQRYLKDGSESFEDEKYAWLAISKETLPTHSQSRILRRPIYRKGVVDLTLCTPEGKQETQSFARSHALYKAARKADWGSSLG